ncbi:MAG: undecaprenyl-diphosphate phosphatase [Oscillospiraceae bacterium]|nr:undecaprenyl-diphosphate phosphatase [Oscillospiraceae bacterium]
MTIFEAIIQGIIQGLTEFLPVSSSGHLSVFQHLFGLSGENGVMVTLVLHLGTLIAVFAAFWGRIKGLIIEFFRMIKDIFTGKFKWKSMNPERRMIVMIVISILPLFIFYIFKDFFEGLSTDSSIVAEGIGFLYTSALLFLCTSRACENGTHTCGQLSARAAVFIGVFQGIALVPGISRSGSTISAGLFVGLKREEAVDYSFILGIPVILAGALLELGDVVSGEGEETVGIIPILTGFAASAVVGYLAIRLIKLLVVSDKFRIFAYYTLIIGIIVLGIGIYEAVSGDIVSFKAAADTVSAVL